jgi:FkbM family methyltransferase
MMQGHFFEEEELKTVSSLLTKDSIILDVGAHIGSHTIYWSKITQAKLIYVVEPILRAYKMLLANLALNYCHNVNVDYIGLALGKDRETRYASQNFENNLGSTSLISKSFNLQREQIKVVPGDDLFADKSIDFIKIDVEKMELDVLYGLKNTIRKNKPIVFIEVQDENKKDFQLWMAENNYKFGDIILDNRKNKGYFENLVVFPK